MKPVPSQPRSAPDLDRAAVARRIDAGALQPILPAMIDSLSDAIVVVDRERRVVAANRRYMEVFGATRENVAGMLCTESLNCPELQNPQASTHCAACRARDEKVTQREIRSIADPHGVPRRWEVTFNPILDGHGKVSHVVEVWRDISERSTLEAQLSHSERLASVGMLAAGVAHEINNPLASVMAGIESLRRTLERGANSEAARIEAIEVAELIQREVARCREITDKLVLLAQPYSVSPTWVDVNRAALDTGSLLRHQMTRQQVEWREAIDPALPLIWARESGIRGVCMNLMLNAVQAMPNGGDLRVGTRRADPFVEIMVEDSGPGIAPEHLSRIWDPFFTTKPAGHGTGLGLFVTHGVVTRYGGSIHVENAEPHGARFVVRLPIEGPNEVAS